MIAVAGEALSHCVKRTVEQIVENIGAEHLKKFYILTDCTSSIPKIGDGPDFPAISADFLRDMEARGLNLTTSVEFLA
jgi:nicotinamidase/pyrazinamidase